MALFEPIFEALNAADARYVVVGGVATVLHGFARLTADVDIIVDLEPAEAIKTIRALQTMGLRPRAPVNAEEFADPVVDPTSAPKLGYERPRSRLTTTFGR